MQAYFTIRNSGGKFEDDTVLRPNTKSSLSMLSCIVISLNFYIGVAPLTIGKYHHDGILLVSLIHLLTIACVYYSCWFVIVETKELRATSLSEAWELSDFRGSTIISIATIVPCLFYISYYVENVIDFVTDLRSEFFPSSPSFISDPFFLALFLAFTVFIPVYVRTDNRYLLVISYAGLLCLAILLAFCIRWFANSCATYGFNPNHAIKVFSISSDLTDCFADYFAIYLNFMFNFYLIDNICDLTAKRMKKVFIISMGTSFIYISLVATLQYFVVFNEFTSGTILDYLPKSDTTVMVSYILIIIKVIVGAPFYLNPIRDSLLKAIFQMKTYPRAIWSISGAILFIVGAMIGTTSLPRKSSMRAVVSSVVMLLQFVVPSILMFKQMKKYPKIHWVGIVALLLFGSAIFVALIIMAFV